MQAQVGMGKRTWGDTAGHTLQASEQTRDWGETNEGKSWNEYRRKSRAEEAEERKSAQAPFDMEIEGKGVNTQTILLQANQRPSCPFFGFQRINLTIQD